MGEALKPNLKTFPRCCLDEAHYCERDAWKADFEASLLNFFNNLEYILEDPNQSLYLKKWVAKRRKEILGDD